MELKLMKSEEFRSCPHKIKQWGGVLFCCNRLIGFTADSKSVKCSASPTEAKE